MADERLIWPERAENVLVIAMMEYLLEKRVLKVESIEGMDEFFPVLEGMIKNYEKVKALNFRKWLEYWARGIHKTHSSSQDIKDCLNELCVSAVGTIGELS